MTSKRRGVHVLSEVLSLFRAHAHVALKGIVGFTAKLTMDSRDFALLEWMNANATFWFDTTESSVFYY